VKNELPPTYYLDHFHEFLQFIETQCPHLLLDEHAEYLQRYRTLTQGAQCLLVRIFNRKGPYVLRSTLHYDEIPNSSARLEELFQHNFVEAIDERHIHEWLPYLKKDELITLLASHADLAAPAPKKSANKNTWLQWHIDHSHPKVLASHAIASDYVAQHSPETLDYLLFLFFGHLSGKLNQFSLRDLGIMATRSNHVSPNARFEHRASALHCFRYLRYLKAVRTLSLEQCASEAEGALALDPAPCGQSQALKDEYLYKLGKRIEEHDHSLALALYDQSQHAPAIEKRIRERYKLGDIASVEAELDAILASPENEHLCIFAEDFYQRKFNKKRTSVLTDVLRNSPPSIPLDEAFLGQVESGVVNHYRRQGHTAFICENHLWRALFTITFWPELFEHPSSGVCNEFDYRPQLIQNHGFYSTLEDEIHTRLNTLTDSATFKRHLTQQYTRHYGKGNGIFYWHSELLTQLHTLVDFTPTDSLTQVLLAMAKDTRHALDGYPDLCVIENQTIRFEEIKAPGDQLRRNQLASILRLQQAGISVSVQTTHWELNPDQPYVVVDIETTGGAKGHHRITEVGMVKLVNGEITDTWQSLINPLRHIPANITQLTGISNDMVKDAPVFNDVMDEIEAFTEGCIFVAHNVNFDYGFFKLEFERFGREYKRPKLCTVQLSRKHLPGHDSYSLGKLCRALEIELENHHRALDDAKAAAHILQLVNEKRGG